MSKKQTNNWEKEFFELGQDCCVPHIIDDLPDDAWVNGWFEAFEKVKPFIAKTLQQERAKTVEEFWQEIKVMSGQEHRGKLFMEEIEILKRKFLSTAQKKIK